MAFDIFCLGKILPFKNMVKQIEGFSKMYVLIDKVWHIALCNLYDTIFPGAIVRLDCTNKKIKLLF